METYIDKDLLKVFKMNQDEATEIETGFDSINQKADATISSSEALLKSLNVELPAKPKVEARRIFDEISQVPTYESLVAKANKKYTYDVGFQDILTQKEFQEALDRVDEIHEMFAKKTSIINKVDLSFLAIATALQTTKV